MANTRLKLKKPKKFLWLLKHMYKEGLILNHPGYFVFEDL